MRALGVVTIWGVVLLCAASELRAQPRQESDKKVQLRCPEESRKRFNVQAVTIGGDIKPPKKLVDTQPVLPRLPPGTTVTGIWIGEILVGSDGLVADAWAVREQRIDPPSAELNEAILVALRKWEYDPITVEDEPMPFCMVVTVTID